ncbi:protein CWC15 homolog isoform X2 [Parasteatoda tepidariorum]|uniref:protein CWC15 homolog isoform X2 n=1 Tax=Parasteatoda tepidariorum TaxID=114398 RepID=UPI00077F9F98|nr:protein CWC15 homolog [Parasteatoda tepidariorum]XP_015929849.1 protein CWC15 homolog [Parasteatoda tepidariorum]
MTTAARPTFEPARGGGGRGEKDLSALSKQYSSRDLPGHTKLKYRQTGQNTSDELKNRDFRRELEEKERVVVHEREGKRTSRDLSGGSSKKSRLDQLPAANVDADDPVDEDDESDDSDDDDTAELMAELHQIKKERAEEAARKEAERKAQEEKIRTENILRGNPLLNEKAEFKVKRRWDSDVVFKNCAIDEPDRKEKPFINDTLRSSFHKKFMEKYVK